MKHDIAFLHTADVHKPTFQQLVDELRPGLNIRHDVDDALLADAIAAGITPELELRVQAAMVSSGSSGAKVVVCTCSTIGGIAERCVLDQNVVCMRIDRAMADVAVEKYKRILVVAAVESTLSPTCELVQQSCERIGKTPDISLQLIEGAWEHFQSDRVDEYYATIARFIQSNASEYDCVILAQASMAPVATLYADSFTDKGLRVLASPGMGVKAALDIV